MTYERLLETLASDDERIVILTAENRAAIRSLPESLGDRFIDVGICEQTMIGAAAGLALRGRIPVAHALAAFLTMRAYEFIRTDIGIPALPVKLMGFVPGLLSEANGPTHQALEDVALMRGIPNMNVFCPADIDDLLIGLPSVIKSSAPWYVRYVGTPACLVHDKQFIIGKAEIFGSGCDLAIMTYGPLFTQAMKAVELLVEEGISSRVLNLRTLKPIDAAAILRAASECKLLVTLEDHFAVGGLAGIIAELFLKHRVHAPVHMISLGDKWFKPALYPELLTYERLNAADIAGEIIEALMSQSNDPSDRLSFTQQSIIQS